MTDGGRGPFSVGGVDYTNLGSADVEGEATITAGIGARWRLRPSVSVGGLFELPVTTPGNDVTLNQLTFDVVFKCLARSPEVGCGTDGFFARQ